jgi:hypothetical protein
MELKDTVALMTSANYKERFMAEYYQLETRYLKLKYMCDDWDEDTLPFVPTCPRSIYDKQLAAMKDYLDVLVDRAKLENVELVISYK